MNNAIIIIIGNEILSGRTLDKNSNFIAKRCSDIGIDLKEIRVIPDNFKIIKSSVLKASKKCSNVFVTGGIGPTHDDITAEAIAKAFNRKLILNKRAKEILSAYYYKNDFELNESRMKMAYIPSKATLILNPVSAAPGFKIHNVWVMAGVPSIMQAMFLNSVEPKLKKAKKVISRSVMINTPEGDIAKLLEKINEDFINVEIGSYPYFNPPHVGTNVVLRCKERKILSKAVKKLCNALADQQISFSID